ncbi:MAG: tRNA (adenosine(37)-N6)-threonylcarbamoyltransferase complex dimerization subunit type 1 TsaB [Actinobacteria bacterium]|nr:tRNA (adenosine(37)-N6)-threonylcarbamoyltransferase complex dimerization subunit type 1 TsaB [Actinomycetota bacterium]
MLTLAFDTATTVATCALVRDGDVLGERTTSAARVLEAAHDLLAESGLASEAISRLVVGTGPGSFTGIRIGLATARALAFVLQTPTAGITTLAALAAGSPGALPVIDARRGEVFTLLAGAPVCVKPGEVVVEKRMVCVGDGAVRYRAVLEADGVVVPPDASGAHVPHARWHAQLAETFGPAEDLQPLYLRVPDVDVPRGKTL